MNGVSAKPDPLSYSLRREYVDAFLSAELSALAEGDALLDLGGTKTNQRGQFRLPTGTQATVVNFVREKGLDVQADGARLPLRAASFRWALCSEVLEHVRDPRAVLAEMFRVLAPGGKLVATVPFLFRVHADPVDVGRYTEFFWRTTLKEIGYTKLQVTKQGVFWSVAFDMGREILKKFSIEGKRGWLVSSGKRLAPRLRARAVAFDAQPEMQEHDFYGRYVGGYGLVAEKP
jgi:SAM-dependent methyltransferase